MIPTTQLTTFTLCLLLVTNLWSLWRTIRHLSREVGMEAKMIKVARIHQTRKAQHALALVGLVIPIFMHMHWVVALAATLGLLCQSFLLARKAKKLNTEIDAYHRDASILSIDFGTSDHTETGVPLKLWFKRGVEPWPHAELQLSAGTHPLPVECVPPETVHRFFAPRITSSFDFEETAKIFHKIRADLRKHGVSHAIDIKGWNHHPAIREMIERILAT